MQYFLQIYKHHEIRVEMTIANQCTGEQNDLFLFLMKKFNLIKTMFIFSICIYFLPQKNSLFTSDIHYLWNGIDFESVILFIHFYKKFVAQKIRKMNMWLNELDLAIFFIFTLIVACWTFCTCPYPTKV